ncbi:hypothetical protein SUDANB23_06233 (plasmid) [Streptomyces sp. enrichment culture]
MAKSTLYAHFRTKDDLIAAYLRRTDESWMERLREAADAAGPDPAEQLVGLFDALPASFDRHGFFGCPLTAGLICAGAQACGAPGSATPKNDRVRQRKTKRWMVVLTAVAAGICLSTVSLVLARSAWS